METRLLRDRLAQHALDVCAHYLSNGSRAGHYWIVGDVQNTKGRSMHVRLTGPRAGKWTDEATGEHGDLLDLIRLSKNLITFRDVRDEAMTFLAEPRPLPSAGKPPVPVNSTAAAQRLWDASVPIPGTLAERYLRARGILGPFDIGALRYQARCFHRAPSGALLKLPAMIAAVSDLSGKLTGIQRTYLTPDGLSKADMESPRRHMGHILGSMVRLTALTDVLAAGEGIETMLAVRSVLPRLPVVAGLSANHLMAMQFPPSIRRIYIAHDNGPAGKTAAERLLLRCCEEGIESGLLTPDLDDWNSDLLTHGAVRTASRARAQLILPDDG